MGVLKPPGVSKFTLIPNGANSTANVSIYERTPTLDILYVDSHASGFQVAVDPIINILPVF